MFVGALRICRGACLREWQETGERKKNKAATRDKACAAQRGLRRGHEKLQQEVRECKTMNTARDGVGARACRWASFGAALGYTLHGICNLRKMYERLLRGGAGVRSEFFCSCDALAARPQLVVELAAQRGDVRRLPRFAELFQMTAKSSRPVNLRPHHGQTTHSPRAASPASALALAVASRELWPASR